MPDFGSLTSGADELSRYTHDMASGIARLDETGDNANSAYCVTAFVVATVDGKHVGTVHTDGDSWALNTELWMLVIEHRHGTDASAHRSEGAARDALYGFVDQWWQQELPDRPKPDNADEAIHEYFDLTDESYTLAPGAIGESDTIPTPT